MQHYKAKCNSERKFLNSTKRAQRSSFHVEPFSMVYIFFHVVWYRSVAQIVVVMCHARIWVLLDYSRKLHFRRQQQRSFDRHKTHLVVCYLFFDYPTNFQSKGYNMPKRGTSQCCSKLKNSTFTSCDIQIKPQKATALGSSFDEKK